MPRSRCGKVRRRRRNDGRERGNAPRGGEQAPFGGPHVAACSLGFGGKAEITRLHAHRQQRERERNQRIDVGNDAVGFGREHTRVVRCEQVAQKPHDDGAEAVNGRLFRQFFEHGPCVESVRRRTILQR